MLNSLKNIKGKNVIYVTRINTQTCFISVIKTSIFHKVKYLPNL